MRLPDVPMGCLQVGAREGKGGGEEETGLSD